MSPRRYRNDSVLQIRTAHILLTCFPAWTRTRPRCAACARQLVTMNNIKATQSRNEMEIASGLVGDKSWHAQYKDSAYVYVGGFPYDLTEGDLIAVMSQCVPRAVLVPGCRRLPQVRLRTEPNTRRACCRAQVRRNSRPQPRAGTGDRQVEGLLLRRVRGSEEHCPRRRQPEWLSGAFIRGCRPICF